MAVVAASGSRGSGRLRRGGRGPHHACGCGCDCVHWLMSCLWLWSVVVPMVPVVLLLAPLFDNGQEMMQEEDNQI